MAVKITFATSTTMIGHVRLNAGEPWDADDPFVKANRQHFADEPPSVRRTVAAPAERPIERGTRAPGERRPVRRGSGDSAAGGSW